MCAAKAATPVGVRVYRFPKGLQVVVSTTIDGKPKSTTFDVDPNVDVGAMVARVIESHRTHGAAEKQTK